MPEERRDLGEVQAPIAEVGGEGVPQVIKPEAGDPGPGARAAEGGGGASGLLVCRARLGAGRQPAHNCPSTRAVQSLEGGRALSRRLRGSFRHWRPRAWQDEASRLTLAARQGIVWPEEVQTGACPRTESRTVRRCELLIEGVLLTAVT